ncbi:MAG: hypothetical protein ACLPKI_17370 [Streptosporangiaceae bacterium]
MFRSFIQTADYPGTEFRRWQQILAALSRCIQARHCLIEIRANPAHQPGGGHKVSERLTQRRGLTGLGTARRG